jgi:hypothetical protein
MTRLICADQIRRKLATLHQSLGDLQLGIDSAAVAAEIAEALRTDVRAKDAPLIAEVILGASSGQSMLTFLKLSTTSKVDAVRDAHRVARQVFLDYLNRLVNSKESAKTLQPLHARAIREVVRAPGVI